ncbi:hypothetical protein [Persephonella sp.]
MAEIEFKEYIKEIKDDFRVTVEKLEQKIDALETDIRRLNSKIAYITGFSSGTGVLIGILISKIFH